MAALFGRNATLSDPVTMSGSVPMSIVAVNLALQAQLRTEGGEEVEEQADAECRESCRQSIWVHHTHFQTEISKPPPRTSAPLRLKARVGPGIALSNLALS